MRLLITGAAGQLGSELETILSSGHADIGPLPAAYQNAELLLTDTADLDITDADKVERYLAANAVDIVFNCAAFTNVDACESQPELAFSVNATGPQNLATACERHGAVLVHLSTDYVFSGDEASARSEGDPVAPKSVYGESKLAGEKAVAEACRRHFIVRTAWLYGSVGNNFVRTILRLARENGVIKVVDDQRGNPTNANDLAWHLLRLALSEDFGLYHCSGNGSCSWFEFASAIVDGAQIPCEKIPCTTAEFPRPAPRPAFSILDNARLRASIGDAMRPWPEALAAFLSQVSAAEKAAERGAAAGVDAAPLSVGSAAVDSSAAAAGSPAAPADPDTKARRS
ncbi:MAG: dTDP-4-dehydrorhamnose reductase [Coriobacteriales bacterium]|nr:dTDP-4-dehydrorhamnose reductase [Coriobacteriales bacterium]